VGVRVADRFGNSTMPRNGELRATMEGPGGSVDLSACLLVEARGRPAYAPPTAQGER
jgi:hypothetical protein